MGAHELYDTLWAEKMPTDRKFLSQCPSEWAFPAHWAAAGESFAMRWQKGRVWKRLRRETEEEEQGTGKWEERKEQR